MGRIEEIQKRLDDGYAHDQFAFALCDAVSDLEYLTIELAASQSENTKLRAALAVSKDPCIYCQLPADEMAKCESGFPGCGRADDIVGCPHLGAELQLKDQLAEKDRERKDLAMLVRRLCYAMSKTGTHAKLQEQSLDYLKRKGLQGDILREERTNGD